MLVNKLLRDKLIYELRIRSIATGKIVEKNRQLLRCALRDIIPIKEDLIPTDIAKEIDTCDGKVVNLSADINNVDMQSTQNKVERICVRLNHVRNRLLRLPIHNSDIDKDRECLLTRCQSLLDEVQSISYPQTNLNNRTSVAIMDLSVEDLPGTSKNATSVYELSNRNEVLVYQLIDVPITLSPYHSNLGPSQCEPRLRSLGFDDPFDLTSVSRVACAGDTYGIRAPISKWGVTFDGNSSVTDFLERVDELRLFGVSKL